MADDPRLLEAADFLKADVGRVATAAEMEMAVDMLRELDALDPLRALLAGGRAVSAPTIEDAARAGLTPQEWAPGGNRCMKATAGKTGRCHNRARWCDTEAAARYDRYDFTNREPGSYAYKVCNRHAAVMVANGG